MTEKASKYITTTLPYVNAVPHVGFALELVQADTTARYFRLLGHDVFFSTGTDEHGQKIAEKADSEGQDRQAYVDHFAGEFERLKEVLNLSYDNFIRTTDEAHKEAAQEMWRRCEAAGDIYKKKYSGLYCVGCESFKTESDLVDGKCPDHPNMTPEEVEEENYFFKLSNYQDYLEEYLSNESMVVPDYRRLDALRFVQGGLEDLSISRRKDRMDWGIAVPGDDEHVMYVWFDALTNYISTTGWPNDEDGTFATFWEAGEKLQFAGKDQIRFQSIIWQAMLKSAGVSATDQVFYHGFINSGGQKMSKSLGNVISPYELVERYGTDATRYLLLRHVHPTDDSDITWEKMDEWYTAGLVNGLGNVTARVMKMAETHLDEPITVEAVVADEKFSAAMQQFEYQAAIDRLWAGITAIDEKITETEPFRLVKTDKAAAQLIIRELVASLYAVATQLPAILPEAAEAVQEAVRANKKPDNLFSRLES